MRNQVVYVLNIHGRPLMPCSPRKARVLLKEGKAKVVQRTPFTIQLNYHCGSARQKTIMGIDTGYEKVGLVVNSERKELYAEELSLRTDIIKLLAAKHMFRRGRRSRKTRYRQARFLNRTRTKKKGWLAPSIQHKLDSHIRAVDRIKKILPISKIIVEVAAFDVQKIKDPEIKGKEYQQGEKTGFWNNREYVLYRDAHKCRHCKGKSKDPILEVHHIIPRKLGGSDRPENLLLLCETCHKAHHAGRIKLKAKPKQGYKAETFMNIIRNRLAKMLSAKITYGYRTKRWRAKLGLGKSHINDAFVIAYGRYQARCQQYQSKMVRKQNRKLYKGSRSHLKNTASRYVHGFQRYDKINYDGMECFVFSRRIKGYFEIRSIKGDKIHSGVSFKKLFLLESARTKLVSPRSVANVQKI